MDDMYSRTSLILGDAAVEKLKRAAVLVVGLGGVGGHALEALARAGVGRLGLVDFDVVDVTNINRQILAMQSTVGRLKANVAAERVKDINPAADVELFALRVTQETIRELSIDSWDFVVDAIDDVDAKLLLIKAACDAGVPVVSSMGTGNKLEPSKFLIAPIEKTNTCPLARVMRKKLKDLNISRVPVLFSTESPVAECAGRGGGVPSISYMPAIAGLTIAGYVIRNISDI